MSETNTPVSQPAAQGDAGKPIAPQAADASGVVAPSAPAGVSSEMADLVAAPEYFGDLKIAPEYVRHYEYLAQVLGGSGVRQDIAIHGMNVLEDMPDELPEQKPAHSYDLSRYRNDFKAEDQGILTYFLNAMHAKGARPAEVNSFLNLYVDAQRTRAKRAALNAGKSELQKKPANDMGLEEIRAVMKTDRLRYNRDERMQARYRALIST